MRKNDNYSDSMLLWQNISELPYFRGFLRAVEGRYLRNICLEEPILDLGCGDGHFMARSLPLAKMDGIDPSFASIQCARGYSYYHKLICSRGCDLPFPEATYQTIISNSVLEHIENIEDTIREIFRVMKNGAKLILTVPNSNFSHYLSVALFFDRIGFCCAARLYRSWFNRISRHYHAFSTHVWEKKLVSAGFNLLDSFEYFSPQFLQTLEWGHYFGLPTLLNKWLIGRWVLFPSRKNPWLRFIYSHLFTLYEQDAKCEQGTYSLLIMQK